MLAKENILFLGLCAFSLTMSFLAFQRVRDLNNGREIIVVDRTPPDTSSDGETLESLKFKIGAFLHEMGTLYKNIDGEFYLMPGGTEKDADNEYRRIYSKYKPLPIMEGEP